MAKKHRGDEHDIRLWLVSSATKSPTFDLLGSSILDGNVRAGKCTNFEISSVLLSIIEGTIINCSYWLVWSLCLHENFFLGGVCRT